MGETPFHTFIELVQLDQEVNVQTRKITSLEKNIEQMGQQEKELEVSLAHAKQHVAELQKEVDSQELEMKLLDQREAEKKSRLETVNSHKEYQSIKSEIDHLKQSQHALEDVLIEAWNKLELAKKDFLQRQLSHDEQIKKIHDSIAQLQEEKNKHQQEVEKLIGVRAPVEATVPDEWLQKYASMRTKISDPVVPLVQGSCSSCFMPVSGQELIALQHRRLIQCKDCFRLLYLAEVHQAVSEPRAPQ